MVPPFNDACFNGNKGDMPIVVTQFGVHLIEILDKSAPQKMVRVAIVERKVEPSQKTYDIEYQKAQAFAASALTAEEFDNAVIKQGLNKRIADNIRESDKNIAGLEQPRELIRWAYKAKKNDVSKVFTFGDKYVIAKLTDVREKGTLPMEEVMDQVRGGAIKAKKAQKIMDDVTAKAQGATSIDAVSQKINKQWSIVDNVSFANNSIPGLGNEPAIVGTIFSMKTGQLSKPVKGENAVFVLYLERFIEPAPTKDYSASQRQIMDSRKSRTENEVFSALKEKAEIEDNRGKFY
jgi:peptidyl-prolyl cis-trans isomerase D